MSAAIDQVTLSAHAGHRSAVSGPLVKRAPRLTPCPIPSELRLRHQQRLKITAVMLLTQEQVDFIVRRIVLCQRFFFFFFKVEICLLATIPLRLESVHNGSEI